MAAGAGGGGSVATPGGEDEHDRQGDDEEQQHQRQQLENRTRINATTRRSTGESSSNIATNAAESAPKGQQHHLDQCGWKHAEEQ